MPPKKQKITEADNNEVNVLCYYVEYNLYIHHCYSSNTIVNPTYLRSHNRVKK